MQVNGDINFTGALTLQGRDIKQFLDSHYELGLVLVRDWETDRKSTRLNSSHLKLSRMPSSA